MIIAVSPSADEGSVRREIRRFRPGVEEEVTVEEEEARVAEVWEEEAWPCVEAPTRDESRVERRSEEP